MSLTLQFSPKQKHVWRETVDNHHRWNICGGAVRSGKTYLDLYKLMVRLRAVADKPGLKVLVGNTQSTLDRNILEPMREIWGDEYVGRVTVNNRVRLFGVDAYALGASNANQLKRVQGGSWAYGYGDEIPTWHPDVFQMIKSRLDKPYSVFDGTYNPDHPQHWFKKFLDSDTDIFHEHFTIDDNPFLPAEFVANLKHEYTGTIYYDRYILGKWCAGEGAIYRIFIEHESEFVKPDDQLPPIDYIFTGVDPGGNKSAHAIVTCGINTSEGNLVVLKSDRILAPDTTPEILYQAVADHIESVEGDFGTISCVFFDNEAQTLLNGLRDYIETPVKGCKKGAVNDRILATISLLNRRKLAFRANFCDSLKAAMKEAVYDQKASTDVRLDDGTSDIDSLDAFEYSWSSYLRLLTGR